MKRSLLLLFGMALQAQICFATEGGNVRQVQLNLFDASLLDQDGQALRLLSDVLRDRIAVVDFIYASCTTTCPLLSQVMGKLQRALGNELGSKVVLVSITVDPLHDTPAKLAAYAKKFGRQEGWYWLTGKRPEVELLLRRFGAYVANPEAHQTMFLVGRAAAPNWQRFVGLPGIEELTQMIDQFK